MEKNFSNGGNMKAVCCKVLEGEVVSSIERECYSVEELLNFLHSVGYDITYKQAIIDYMRPVVTYRQVLDLTVASNMVH